MNQRLLHTWGTEIRREKERERSQGTCVERAPTATQRPVHQTENECVYLLSLLHILRRFTGILMMMLSRLSLACMARR